MRIPRRPGELSTTISAHAELSPNERPVFVYRFPEPEDQVRALEEAIAGIRTDPEVLAGLRRIEDPEEQAAEIERILTDGNANTTPALLLCRLFDQQLVRIENLHVGGEAFDRGKHLRDLPGAWKLEVGREIQTRVRAYLSEFEAGNSFSPSPSDETSLKTPDTDGVAAAAASTASPQS